MINRDYKIHKRQEPIRDFNRLDLLWKRYPKYHEKTIFSTLDQLLEEHESYQEDFSEELRKEYLEREYEKFLVQLSWTDLPYRQGTRLLIEQAGNLPENPYVSAFMKQFEGMDTDHRAYFIFPESFTSTFYVLQEVCKQAETFYPINNLFPDEKTVHYLAVFEKANMEDVLLMHHLLPSASSDKITGGYSLYDYSFPWYQNHLWENGLVLRSPYLPDRLAKYLGNIPFYHNPTKTVYVRRNIEHMLACGYFASELELFRNLTEIIMPHFQWWYQDLAMYEENDGLKTNWRLERTRIRTDLTARGLINPKWKHEVSLFHALRAEYPDILYQYRPEWLNRQSLDLYIPSLKTGIEYQGIQHYQTVEFFGGEEALLKRQELDETKRQLCLENGVRLIEWPYTVAPDLCNFKGLLEGQDKCGDFSD